MEKKILTLGSLFDGSGGFPLGGVLNGIKPLWASEIEPFPIRVTTRRFPEMKHLGDISKIKGSEIEPVDIITFGSPCVDMSIAGKREGLNASRSGLFFEAMRIIREMREATDNQNPRFIVWENVTGAFSSNKGADFREVIQEIVNVRYKNVSVPQSEKWHTGGLIVEDDFSLAWRVFDAQYWGVPQRRKRIYLVADFRGQCAGKILFESEGLSGNTQKSFFQGQGAAGSPSESTEESGGCIALENHPADSRVKLSGDNKVQTLTSRMGTGGNNVPMLLKIRCGKPGGGKGPLIQKDRSATLSCNNDQTLFEPKVYGICSKGSNAMLSDNPNSGFYEAKTTRTIDANGGSPCCNQGGMAVVAIEGNGARPSHKGDGYKQTDKMYTLNTVEQHAVAYGIGRTVFCQAYNSVFSFPIEEEKAQTVLATGPGAVGVPSYGIDRAAFNQGKNAKFGIAVEEEKEPPIVARGPNAVAEAHFSINKSSHFTDAIKDKSGPLFATDYKDPPIVTDTDNVKYIVRRLTPTECARLQGFPDWWCSDLECENPTEEELSFWKDVFRTYSEINGTKEKPDSQILRWLKDPHSDAAEYKMWGNGVALPCVMFVLAGIAYFAEEKYRRCIDDKTGYD